MASVLRVRVMTLGNTKCRSQPCDGTLLPNLAGVPQRSFVQVLGSSRLRGSISVLPWHQRCRSLVDVLRLQPARYVFAVGFQHPFTPIVAPPLESPVPCRVR